tara:strand:- start:5073 stop:7925 length:2853 start_codon:yes stop_codon:yes gene_type:complete
MNFDLPPINVSTPEIPEFTTGMLASMPSTALTSVANSQSALLTGINTKASGLKKRAEKLSGTSIAYLPTQGRIPMESAVSADKVASSAAAAVGPILSTASLISKSIEMEEDVLENAEAAGTDNDLAKDMSNAVQGLITSVIPSGDDPSQALELASIQAGLASFAAKAGTLNSNLKAIESVLSDRASGVLEEPRLRLDHLITVDDPSIDNIVSNFSKYVTDNIVEPFEENVRSFGTLAQITQLEFQEDPPMFDFTYGPPVSEDGIFILSEDGLYYDSIKGGIPEVSGVVIASKNWDLRYAPNIGGKGKTYNNDNLRNVSDNVFAADYTTSSYDENIYYETDEVLRLVQTNKQVHLDLIRGQINDLIASGVSESSAAMVNHYNNIGAIAAMYAERTSKRKKQLQLVSIFGTDEYSHTEQNHPDKDLGLGNGILIHNEGTSLKPEWHPVERIPINDFSFLKGTGAGTTVEQQESILLFSEDLDDIILPITPNFSRPTSQPYSYLDNFTISPIEEGVFPYNDGDSNVSSTANTILSLTNSVVQSGMILNYNFLSPKVTSASSSDFDVVDEGPSRADVYNGQLVASSTASVFPSGIAIPFLTGTSGGSYVRLPNNITPNGLNQTHLTQDINNLFYPANRTYDSNTEKGGGVSFDFWIHMPDLVFTDSHRYKLVAACENSGGNQNTGSRQLDVNSNRTLLSGLMDTSKVHGMIMGFRDKGGISNPQGLEFGIWPTVSQNRNDGEFGHSIVIAEDIDNDELGVTLASSIELEGTSIIDASGTFLHMAVVFDFKSDTLNIYADGVLLKSRGIKSSFDMQESNSLNIPSFTTSGDNLTSSWQSSGDVGPNVGASALGLGFTPWILGGGFSDTIPRTTYGGSLLGTRDPGFLGYNSNKHYGSPPASQHSPNLGSGANPSPTSGLDGFLGSFKLYSKALSNNEVRTNFKVQKGFFKNIKIS